MRCILVSHTHWDREWYRTFQQFRARLVDTIDRVLDLIAVDAGFHFLLDGQTIVLEDYLEIRPQRRDELIAACRNGRVAIGPWYVQPDSLLPSGEAHVRNLLEGLRVGEQFGRVSSVAYTPDSFGHPAQFPQLFAGFGLEPFIYWRGNGDEIDQLPSEYVWEAPDGSRIIVHHLSEGYFNVSGLPRDAAAAAQLLEQVARRLGERTGNEAVLLMNGIDHALPDAHTASAAAELARATGWTVTRGLLEDFAACLTHDAPRFRGELLGGRVANLLAGVWSTRMPLKLRNRRCEMLLESWAEPWGVIGRAFGVPDEQPSIRSAWRSLLPNQAHDSICGCSQDRVHEQMISRYDAAEELATQTTVRVLERLAGLGAERRTPWSDAIDIAVFNPSPHSRTDVVRFALDASSWFETRGEATREISVHPLLAAAATASGFTIDGQPARLVGEPESQRVWLLPDVPPRSVEFVAADVPPFGWRRYRLRTSEAHPDGEDAGDAIGTDQIAVTAAGDGTFTVRFGTRTFRGVCALDDVGDRGDTYDFDPVTDGQWSLQSVQVRRRAHVSGLQSLTVRRVLSLPARLDDDRLHRSAESVALSVEVEARVIPNVARVDLCVRIDNTAADHRLRLLFPTGAPAADCLAATTFDVARRSTALRDATGWRHPAPPTFPQQGFVHANGLTVAAPGLPEAEVTSDGVIAITLLRAVGWLARLDLQTRPEPAGPMLRTAGAQCLGPLTARLALFDGLDVRAVQDAEIGLWGVVAGDQPLLPPNQSMLEVEPREVVLSALLPSTRHDGCAILRLLNPSDDALHATVRLGLPVSRVTCVRLDEKPTSGAVAFDGQTVSVQVPAHALRSLLLSPK